MRSLRNKVLTVVTVAVVAISGKPIPTVAQTITSEQTVFRELSFETTVVGDSNPINTGQYCAFLDGPNPGSETDKDIRDCYLAQAFTLNSPTVVDQVNLTLIANSRRSSSAVNYPFLLVIASDLNSCYLSSSFPVFPPADCSGPAVRLLRKESVAIPRSTNDQFISFTDSFPAIVLPKGTYYLIVGSPNGVHSSVDATLTWAPNQIGSSEVGVLGPSFCSSVDGLECSFKPWYLMGLDPTQEENMAGTNGTFAFALRGPTITSTPVGIGLGQILRILVAGPVTPPPGGPVQAQLGFVDIHGNSIGPTATVTVEAGQIRWLDLNSGEVASQFGHRIEVVPSVTQPANTYGSTSSPTGLLSISVQVLDERSGFEIAQTPIAPQDSAVSQLVPQVLAADETMRINVVAPAFASCRATLGFADKNGKPLGPSLPVNLNSGRGTLLDLDGRAIGLAWGKSTEIQPIVSVTTAQSQETLGSVCQVSVEVFERLSGRTHTSQSAMVQQSRPASYLDAASRASR